MVQGFRDSLKKKSKADHVRNVVRVQVLVSRGPSLTGPQEPRQETSYHTCSWMVTRPPSTSLPLPAQPSLSLLFRVIHHQSPHTVLPRGASAFDPLAACDPDCTGTVNGDKVVDPQNCTNFYYCINGQPASHATPCDTGNIFDPTVGKCVVGATCDPVCGPGGLGCALTCTANLDFVADAFDCSKYYYCTPSGPMATSCPVDRPYFDGTACVNDDSVCCPGYCEPYCEGTGFSMVPDPLDCTMFYICDDVEGVPGPGVHFSCGAGEYFNIARGDCEAGIPNPCHVLCDVARRR